MSFRRKPESLTIPKKIPAFAGMTCHSQEIMNFQKIKATLSSWPGFLMVFICVFTFLNFFRPIEIEDVWWHLKTGEWIVTHFQVPHYDPFPFANEKTPWIFTEWLGSSFLYLVYKFVGLCGLKVFRALFFVGVVLLFFRYAVKRVRLPIVMALVLLLLPALYSRSNLRPDIFNYIFIQIFLINLFRYQESNDIKALFALPLLGILWSNMHLGSFVYGGLLIGTFLLSNMCTFTYKKISRSDGWELFQKKTKALFWVFILYFASFLVSPYGWGALFYPFKVFLVPGYIHFYSNLNTIEELSPALIYFRFYNWYTGFWVVPLFILTLFALFKKENKENRLLHLLLFSFSFCLFLRSVRAGAFFALVACYVVVESLKNSQSLKSFALNKFQKCFWVIVISFLLLKGFFLYSKMDLKNGHFVRRMSLDIDAVNPGSALRFMDRYKLYGPIFNSDLFGGYLIWNAYPRLRPFIDGRNISQRYVKYYQIIKEPKKYWARAESEFGFKILLLDTRYVYSFSLIRVLNRNDWQLVYYDDASVVFVRRNNLHLPKDILLKYPAVKYSPANIIVN